jgi:dephospho-CoA kinase
MLRLGITGGIGSGKTLVCSIFSHMGVPVYNADTRAKWLVNNDPALRVAIIANFGSESYTNGTYNAPFISKIVFADKAKLELLNSIIHPVVFRDWEGFCAAHKNNPIVIKEAAIMFETDSKYTVDKIVLVYAPEDLRIQRVMERDKISEEAVRVKLKAQMPEEEKLKLADHVIINDGEQSLLVQVRALYSELLGKD